MLYRGSIKAKEVEVEVEEHYGDAGLCNYCRERAGLAIEVRIISVTVGRIRKSPESEIWQTAEQIVSEIRQNGKHLCKTDSCIASREFSKIEKSREYGFKQIA